MDKFLSEFFFNFIMKKNLLTSMSSITHTKIFEASRCFFLHYKFTGNLKRLINFNSSFQV
jgi:hypothetical protein